jgi:hypothetical protein
MIRQGRAVRVRLNPHGEQLEVCALVWTEGRRSASAPAMTRLVGGMISRSVPVARGTRFVLLPRVAGTPHVGASHNGHCDPTNIVCRIFFV